MKLQNKTKGDKNKMKKVKESENMRWKNFLNNHTRLILYSFFILAFLSNFVRFLWLLIIPHLILSLWVWYDIIKTKRKKK